MNRPIQFGAAAQTSIRPNLLQLETYQRNPMNKYELVHSSAQVECEPMQEVDESAAGANDKI